MTMNMPYRSRNSSTWCRWYGKRANRIFDPSSGGTGSRFKKARIILIKTTKLERVTTVSGIPKKDERRISIPKKIAIKIFESGPAKATNAPPYLGFFKLYGL